MRRRFAIAARESCAVAARFALAVTRAAIASRESKQTKNRVEPGDIAAVRRIFDELKSASGPFSFYQQVIDKRAREPDESGLGLARIAAEADMTMDQVVDGDSLTIVSRRSVDLQEGGR